MKTLNTIQTLSKIAKVFSNIIFIFSIVCLCLSIVGILSLAFSFESFKLGGVTINSLLTDKGNMAKGTIYADLAQSIVYCIGALVLSKFAEKYFVKELKDGTPFTFDGAKDLLRLGILFICIPIGAEIIASIADSIIVKVFADAKPSEFDAFGSVAIGIAFIIISLICKYGAEQFVVQNKAEHIEKE